MAGETPTPRLHLRLPAFAILTAPEVHGFVVANDLAVFFAGRKHAVDAVSNIAEVAEQCALMSLFDVGVGPLTGLDAVKEVGDVLAAAGRAALLLDFLVLDIEQPVAAAINDQRSLFTVEA